MMSVIGARRHSKDSVAVNGVQTTENDSESFVRGSPGGKEAVRSSGSEQRRNASVPMINGGSGHSHHGVNPPVGWKTDASVLEERVPAVTDPPAADTWPKTLEVQNPKDDAKLPSLDSPSHSGLLQSTSTPKQSGIDFEVDLENNLVPDPKAAREMDQRSFKRSALEATSELPSSPASGFLQAPQVDSESELVKAWSKAGLSPAEQLWITARDGAVKLRMSDSGLGSATPMTVCEMFQETVANFGDLPALGSKQDGAWVTLSFKEYYQQCRAAAKSFLKLGLERYHGVGILGFNSPEWFIADIGCIMAGGLAVGIYTTNTAEACQYVADNCDANVLVVENHKQLLKILKVKDQLPHLKAIVQYKDELQVQRPDLYTWKEFLKLGEAESDQALDAIIQSQKANECCSLIYTSGTTGNPKGVMLSHDNITWTANAAGTMTGLKKGEEVVVSYLPLSHVAAQVNDMWICMRFAGTTYFADPDALKGTLVNTMREVRPTSFLGVPRVWEKMQEKMKAVGSKSSAMRKRVADWAKSIGLQASRNAMDGNLSVPWGFMLANNLVFKKVRLALGLDRCKSCYTGAAPITKDTLEYFMSLNIPLFELYGMSESTGPHSISWNGGFRTMSCGKVVIGCKTKLDKPDEEGNGEICFWGRHVFMGYLDMPEKTEEAVDQEGWLHSGDLGKHDEDGFLFITGRIKEIIVTAGGENIPPVPIEDAVKEEVSIVSNAMLVGDQRKFLSMLLTLKCNVDDAGEPTDELAPPVVDFCQERGVVAARISDITAKKEPAIYQAVQEGMERVNARATSNAQKVQKWVILGRDFSISGGELGPTMKLKRPVVHKMYEEEIDRFYAD